LSCGLASAVRSSTPASWLRKAATSRSQSKEGSAFRSFGAQEVHVQEPGLFYGSFCAERLSTPGTARMAVSPWTNGVRGAHCETGFQPVPVRTIRCAKHFGLRIAKRSRLCFAAGQRIAKLVTALWREVTCHRGLPGAHHPQQASATKGGDKSHALQGSLRLRRRRDAYSTMSQRQPQQIKSTSRPGVAKIP